MRPLTVADAPMVVLGLQNEIRRSGESRYDHRLHGVLLVAQGMKCSEAARILGDAPRTVQYWVNRFEEDGLAGLLEAERTGRPTRLGSEQLEELGLALRKSPTDVGLSCHLWDGKAVAAFLEEKYHITLGVRQCQRVFHQLEFRLRKPRPVVGHADPSRQDEYNKNSKS